MSNNSKPEESSSREKVSEEDKFFASISGGRWTPEQLAEIREESHLISQNFFVNQFLPYLKKTIRERDEYCYLDLAEAENSNDLKKHESKILDALAISKVDGLFLTMLSLFFAISAIVNSFYGLSGLIMSLAALSFILIFPFYVGYIQGAIMDDMAKRLRGWEIFIVELIAVFTFLGLLPLLSLVNTFPKVIYLSIGGSMVMIRREWIGLTIPLALVFLETIVLIWGRRKLLVKIITFYFDRYPTKRDQLVKAVTKIGVIPFANPFNPIIAAMKKGKTLNLNWMGRQLRVVEGMIEAKTLLSKILLEDQLSMSLMALFAGITSTILAVIFFYIFGWQINVVD